MAYKKLIIFLAIFTSTAANASSLKCPATVKAGTSLSITATVSNEDCNNPMYINNSVLSLIGNSGNATIGLQGPFVTPLPMLTTIPVAACKSVPYYPDHPEWGAQTVVTPTFHKFSNLVVIAKVPKGMAGTLALVSAGMMDDNNNIHMIGSCPVHITN